MTGPASVSLLYILRAPINFSPADIGFFTAESSGTKVLGSWIANYIILYLMRWPDNATLLIFGITSIGYFLSFAFSVNQWHIYAGKIIRTFILKNILRSKHNNLFSFIVQVMIKV